MPLIIFLSCPLLKIITFTFYLKLRIKQMLSRNTNVMVQQVSIKLDKQSQKVRQLEFIKDRDPPNDEIVRHVEAIVDAADIKHDSGNDKTSLSLLNFFLEAHKYSIKELKTINEDQPGSQPNEQVSEVANSTNLPYIKLILCIYNIIKEEINGDSQLDYSHPSTNTPHHYRSTTWRPDLLRYYLKGKYRNGYHLNSFGQTLHVWEKRAKNKLTSYPNAKFIVNVLNKCAKDVCHYRNIKTAMLYKADNLLVEINQSMFNTLVDIFIKKLNSSSVLSSFDVPASKLTAIKRALIDELYFNGIFIDRSGKRCQMSDVYYLIYNDIINGTYKPLSPLLPVVLATPIDTLNKQINKQANKKPRRQFCICS